MAFADPNRSDDYYKQYREKNREMIRAKGKVYRDANKERLQERGRQYRARNREAILARQKAYRDSEAGREYHNAYIKKYLSEPQNRMRYLVRQAALRAKEYGIAFDPSLKPILMSNPPLECRCCGCAFNFEAIGNGQEGKWQSPSLDRFDNSRGYTVENVKVICMRCNSLKSDATLAEMETVVRYMQGLSADRDHVSAQIILGRAERLQALTSPVAECVA